MLRLLVNLKKHKQGIQLCYGIYNEPKQHSLLSFEDFWFYIWVVIVWVLIFRHKWFQVTSYPIMSMNKKPERKDHKTYIFRNVYIQLIYNIYNIHIQLHQSQRKFNFWSLLSIYMVQTFLKILCWQFLVPRLERFLISSATLSCKTQ